MCTVLCSNLLTLQDYKCIHYCKQVMLQLSISIRGNNKYKFKSSFNVISKIIQVYVKHSTKVLYDKLTHYPQGKSYLSKKVNPIRSF